MPGPLAGHCPAPFSVFGWSKGPGPHVAIAFRVPSGATQPLRRELVDEPDEPYEDYPTETGHNCGAGKKKHNRGQSQS